MKQVIVLSGVLSALLLLFSCSQESGEKKKTFTLNVSALNGTAMISPPGSEFEEGSVVSVRVYPLQGYAFSRWEGDYSTTDDVLQITLSADVTVTGICESAVSTFVWPDELNTGVPAGTELTVYTGLNQTTQDGQLFENLIISKRIYINHANVTFRNCQLTGGADPYYVIYTNKAGVNLTVERCEITNGIKIYNGFVGRANHIHAPTDGYCDDGFSVIASDVLIENNLIDGMRGKPGAHLDGMQIMGGDNIVVRNNWIEAVSSTPIEVVNGSGGVNAALFFCPYKTTLTNVVAEHNMFIQDEGYFPLRIYSTGGAVVVQGNCWSATRHGGGSAYDFRNCTPTLWNGNVYDSGSLIDYP